MKNKATTTLSAALAACIVLGSGEAPRQERLSFFLPSLVIENESACEEERLIVLDGDSEQIEYTFKLAEIFRILFD